MDKNTITGLLLIAAIVIGFTFLTKPSQEELERQKKYNDSIALVQQSSVKEDITKANENQIVTEDTKVDGFFETPAQVKNDSTNVALAEDVTIDSTSIQNVVKPEEKIVSLENSKIKIDFTTKGGQILRSQLKEYTTYQGDTLYLTDTDGGMSLELMNKQGVKLKTKNAYFKAIANSNNDSQALVMRMNYTDSKYIDFIYTLAPDSYMLKFDIAVVGMQDILSKESLEQLNLNWQQDLRRQEKSEKNEQRYARMYYKFIDGNVEELSDAQDDKLEVSVPVKWVSFKDQFFSSTLIADNAFTISQLNSRILHSQEYLKDYSANLFFRPTVDNDGVIKAGFRYFMGPLEYAMLQGFDDGVTDNAQRLDLDKIIPLGWSLFRVVNQFFVIPLFNLLESTGIQMGLVILLLTLIVKLIISPLTYKSFMSSAKMRVLKPQVEVINEKFQGQEKAMDRQKATMELYRQAGVNPMSGCIPMLLQMPILLALFAFFPSAIELRHQSFLWAHDLSTYDAIFEWNANIPFVSSWLGNHISLFCVLMTATNIIYTKFNMDATNTGQQQMPGMKWMMMLMPLIFFFVLNNYPSGLTYYYFLSTLMTILITLAFRYFVDEDKVLAKLEANKKKPKKKGFMSRMQEQAEQAQRAQQQANKGKKKKK